MRIGAYIFDRPLILAPMAGVTDRPYRQLCKKMGADLAVSEMVSSNPALWQSKKSRLRMNHQGENEPRIVQIAGADPHMMAQAAQFNVMQGAQIIDINMGCPAKKVCNRMAGSALMGDEKLAAEIFAAVVKAVNVPVTLKMRTGLHAESKNALKLAKIAEDCGIQALAIHGRTRADAYHGAAEYDTIAAIKQQACIPVFANGDINNVTRAEFVLNYTGADGLLIGRAALGYPWIFREIHYYLRYRKVMPLPDYTEIKATILEHVRNVHAFYGPYAGLRIARKHIGWYLKNITLPGIALFKNSIYRVDDAAQQYHMLGDFLERQSQIYSRNKVA